MTTNDLPEFNVSVQMARKNDAGQTEYRTFTARVPAVDLQHAEAAAYGLGHGINDASRYQWKFANVDPNVSAEPAADTTDVEQLRAKVAELTAELAQKTNTVEYFKGHRERLEAAYTDLTERNIELTAERDAARDMANTARHETAQALHTLDKARAVVEAAKTWAKASVTGLTPRPHEEALYAAVQSLPKAVSEHEYLIWSNHHQAWWGPNSCGYHRNLANAGRYALADAQRELRRGCRCCQVPEVLVRADVVSGAGERTVRGAIAEATKVAIDAGRVNKYFEPAALPTANTDDQPCCGYRCQDNTTGVTA